MIHMGLLNVIRKLRLREKLPIREIARRTGLPVDFLRSRYPTVEMLAETVARAG